MQCWSLHRDEPHPSMKKPQLFGVLKERRKFKFYYDAELTPVAIFEWGPSEPPKISSSTTPFNPTTHQHSPQASRQPGLPLNDSLPVLLNRAIGSTACMSYRSMLLCDGSPSNLEPPHQPCFPVGGISPTASHLPPSGHLGSSPVVFTQPDWIPSQHAFSHHTNSPHISTHAIPPAFPFDFPPMEPQPAVVSGFHPLSITSHDPQLLLTPGFDLDPPELHQLMRASHCFHSASLPATADTDTASSWYTDNLNTAMGPHSGFRSTTYASLSAGAEDGFTETPTPGLVTQPQGLTYTDLLELNELLSSAYPVARAVGNGMFISSNTSTSLGVSVLDCKDPTLLADGGNARLEVSTIRHPVLEISPASTAFLVTLAAHEISQSQQAVPALKSTMPGNSPSDSMQGGSDARRSPGGKDGPSQQALNPSGSGSGTSAAVRSVSGSGSGMWYEAQHDRSMPREISSEKEDSGGRTKGRQRMEDGALLTRQRQRIDDLKVAITDYNFDAVTDLLQSIQGGECVSHGDTRLAKCSHLSVSMTMILSKYSILAA